MGVAPTVYGGHEHTLRQTLIALASGQQLDEHESRGEATLHVLHGPVRLTTDNSYWDATAGDHLVTPPDRHGLEALEDGVVLLTVAIQGSSRHAARPEYWVMAHVMRPWDGGPWLSGAGARQGFVTPWKLRVSIIRARSIGSSAQSGIAVSRPRPRDCPSSLRSWAP